MKHLTLFESFLNEEEIIEFIPFELRMELDPTFIWNKETEREFYFFGRRNLYRLFTPQSVEFLHLPSMSEKNARYLGEMTRLLLGNKIIFNEFDYIKGELPERTCIVGRVIYNSVGVISITTPSNTIRESYIIDERKPVKVIFRKKIISTQDPYGEENWDD